MNEASIHKYFPRKKAIIWNRLRYKTEQCGQCPDLVRSRKLYAFGKPTFGFGGLDSQLVVIGQCPGYKGCGITGIPFTKDRSGRLYQEALTIINLRMEDVYTTNIVKCCPENNRTPTPLEITNCSKILVQELEIIKPKYIVTLGRVAQNIMKKMDLTKKVFHFHVAHPAYYLRKGDPGGFIEAFGRMYIESIPQAKQASMERFL